MNTGFIQLTEALAQMRQTDERGRPVPFSLEATTCDEERGTGGDNMVLTNWVLLTPKARPNNENRVRKTTPAKAAPQELADQMRRVKNPLNDQVRQVHIRLITTFNGLEILW